MELTKEVLTKKRSEYMARLQELNDNALALQGAIQAVDELLEMSESMTETELVEAIERGKQDAS